MKAYLISISITFLLFSHISWSKNVNSFVSRFKNLIVSTLNQDDKDIYQQVLEVNSLYFTLPRSKIKTDDIIDIKMALQQWRVNMTNKLLIKFKNSGNVTDATIFLEILNHIGLKLKSEELENLHQDAEEYLYDEDFFIKYISFLGSQAETNFILSKFSFSNR